MTRQERRLRAYFVSEDLLVTYLGRMQAWPRAFGAAVIRDLPEDATVERVYHDPLRQCLVVHVFHPSFPVVPEGECVPLGHDGRMEGVHTSWIYRDKDGGFAMRDTLEAINELWRNGQLQPLNEAK